MVKRNKKCKVCGSASLSSISISNAQSNIFSGKAQSKNNQDFLLCDPAVDASACGLLQRASSGKKSNISQFNEVPSGKFRVVRDHLRASATEALELISGRDCSALDIGCNDGTLLSYYPRWVERFGVDPDESINAVGEWAWTAQSTFPSPELDEAFGTKCFDIITCISTLEYLDDPTTLLKAVKKRLTNDGVLVLETLYAPMIMTSNNFEALTPQLKSLYSIIVLEHLVRSVGLKIFRGTLTSKEGGSIRLFITHDENDEYDFDPWSERLAKLWDEETVLALRDRAPYQAFQERSDQVSISLQKLLQTIEKRAESVHILGIDEQARNIHLMAGSEQKAITHAVSFEALTSENPDNKSFGKQRLPIISETECRNREPDYLLAPARLKREILENWREMILAGGKVIFASPQPHIVNAANYSAEYGKTLNQGDSAAGVETLRSILHAAGPPRLVTVRDVITAKSA